MSNIISLIAEENTYSLELLSCRHFLSLLKPRDVRPIPSIRLRERCFKNAKDTNMRTEVTVVEEVVDSSCHRKKNRERSEANSCAQLLGP